MAGLTAVQRAQQRKINALDLGSVAQRTRQEQGWTAAQATDAETWYKNFLFMCWINWPNPVIALDRQADKLWHSHILDTSKYKADCDAIFGAGNFLDHHPPVAARLTKAQSTAIAANLTQSVKLFGTIPFDFCPGCWS